MELENKIEEFISKLIIEQYPKEKTSGGQSVRQLISGVKVICKETNFEVGIAYSRGKMDNRDMCIKIYKKYLEELFAQSKLI